MWVTTVSNSLILGGWVAKVLKNHDEKLGAGRMGNNSILNFFCYWLNKKNATLRNCILGNFFLFIVVKFLTS